MECWWMSGHDPMKSRLLGRRPSLRTARLDGCESRSRAIDSEDIIDRRPREPTRWTPCPTATSEGIAMSDQWLCPTFDLARECMTSGKRTSWSRCKPTTRDTLPRLWRSTPGSARRNETLVFSDSRIGGLGSRRGRTVGQWRTGSEADGFGCCCCALAPWLRTILDCPVIHWREIHRRNVLAVGVEDHVPVTPSSSWTCAKAVP